MTKLEKTPDKNLYLDKESGIYVWREHIHGVPHWRSTGAKTIGLARSRVKDFRANITGDGGAKLKHTFNEVFDILLTIQSAKAEKTFKSTQTQLKNLRPWFQEHCPYLSDFERRFEELWSQYRRDQELIRAAADKKPRKLKHDRECLLMALKRAKDKGWIKREFKKTDLHLKEATESIGRMLEEDELNRLIPEVKKHDTLYLQFMLAVLMGFRLGEALHLRWDEIDFRNQRIHLGGKRVKTRYGRVVPIHQKVLPYLRERSKDAQGDFVFPAHHTNIQGTPFDYSKPQGTNDKAWQTALAAAGVKCRFHDLRHTAISFMVNSGIPDQIVSKVTGASLAVIRRVYLHLNIDMNERIQSLTCGKVVGLE